SSIFILSLHDALPILRKNLVILAEQYHRREKLKGTFDPEALVSRLAFRTWFVAHPGRVHIEHGHQHDPYCSFEYHLAPFDAHERSEEHTSELQSPDHL